MVRRVARAVGLGLSIGLLALVAGLALVLVVVPKATGATPLTVLTGSMAPHLPPGTLVVIRPVPVDRLRVGEVATYQIASGRPEVVTHRITAITTTSTGQRLFTFRGDANPSADAMPVRAVQIRGALWYSVPGFGWANEAVNGRARAWVIPVVAGALFVYSGTMISAGVVGAVRRRANARARRRRRHVHSME